MKNSKSKMQNAKSKIKMQYQKFKCNQMQCNESPTLKVVYDVRIHDAMAKYDCENYRNRKRVYSIKCQMIMSDDQ